MGSGVSLKPSDAVAGGSAFDDVDVVVKQCRFRLWDYNGKIANPVLGLAVGFVNPSDGFEFEQVYSAGETKHFVPSEDGRFAVPVGKQTGLVETSNAILFLTSFVNCGFPENKIADDVSVFENTLCHVNQVPQPKRPGMPEGGKDKTILVVSKIHKLPWENQPATTAKAAPKKVGKATTAPAQTVQQGAPQESNGGSGITTKADDTLMAILAAKGGSIPKVQVSKEAFVLLAKDPDRTAVMQMIYKDEYLGSEGKPWNFDGATISL